MAALHNGAQLLGRIGQCSPDWYRAICGGQICKAVAVYGSLNVPFSASALAPQPLAVLHRFIDVHGQD
jgi:hypothetical protein